jgi:hypothetical protein
MRWVKFQIIDGKQIYGRIDDDGLMRVTCVEEHLELQDWLAKGNVAEEWNPNGN